MNYFAKQIIGRRFRELLKEVRSIKSDVDEVLRNQDKIERIEKELSEYLELMKDDLMGKRP